jgi:hypothetical protein
MLHVSRSTPETECGAIACQREAAAGERESFRSFRDLSPFISR